MRPASAPYPGDPSLNGAIGNRISIAKSTLKSAEAARRVPWGGDRAHLVADERLEVFSLDSQVVGGPFDSFAKCNNAGSHLPYQYYVSGWHCDSE
jgi:hypothetical protein